MLLIYYYEEGTLSWHLGGSPLPQNKAEHLFPGHWLLEAH